MSARAVREVFEYVGANWGLNARVELGLNFYRYFGRLVTDIPASKQAEALEWTNLVCAYLEETGEWPWKR